MLCGRKADPTPKDLSKMQISFSSIVESSNPTAMNNSSSATSLCDTIKEIDLINRLRAVINDSTANDHVNAQDIQVCLLYMYIYVHVPIK